MIDESWEHTGMVAMIMRKSDDKLLVANPFGYQGLKGFLGIVRPLDVVGQVNQQGFFLTHQQIHVRTIVEVGLLALFVELFTGRIGIIEILDVIHIVRYDRNGIRTYLYIGYFLLGGATEKDHHKE